MISSQTNLSQASWAILLGCLILVNPTRADLREDALASARRATQFLQNEVSTQGGYLWRYSADLRKREGEGVVKTETIWTQPPGTPTVGEAFLDLYSATGDPLFLDAAQAAGNALLQGQMLSGGWQASVEFEPELRQKWAYRTNEKQHRRAKDQSSLDDDKTQSSLRFLIRLDQALGMKHQKIHEAVLYSLDGLLRYGQFSNGGFPQVYSQALPTEAGTEVSPSRPAQFPATWSREYPGHGSYWYRFTLNDNLAPDVFETLMLAYEVYDVERFRQAAERLGDFLLLAQLPEPQPAWAQQYNYAMEPIWARKFEPPAVTGGESQGVIRTLMEVYRQTGKRKYLEPIPRALDYLENSELPDGRLARFYELKTNRPLYFTKEYKLTYDDSDMPTHYGFQVASSVDKLRREYQRLAAMSASELEASHREDKRRPPTAAELKRILNSQDERGAWVSSEGMRYHNYPGDAILMDQTVDHLKTLAAFLAL